MYSVPDGQEFEQARKRTNDENLETIHNQIMI